MYGQVFTYDFDKVPQDIIEGIIKGGYKIYDGVVRDSGNKYQIIKHLPLKPLNDIPSEVYSLAGMSTKLVAANAAIVGVATVAVMGAIIVATKYLANKIDKLQLKIDEIQKELKDQNLLFYLKIINDYYGVVLSAREILYIRKISKQNYNTLILQKLSELSTERNKLVSIVDNILNLIGDFSVEHQSICIDFVNNSLDLLPKGVFIESQLAYASELFEYGDQIREFNLRKYEHLIEQYKQWGNQNYQKIVTGKIDNSVKVFDYNVEELKQFFGSTENQKLLSLPV